ncbi:MAG: hypothetical protein AAFU66_05460, partial [Pseudomonadota bacterium]
GNTATDNNDIDFRRDRRITFNLVQGGHLPGFCIFIHTVQLSDFDGSALRDASNGMRVSDVI